MAIAIGIATLKVGEAAEPFLGFVRSALAIVQKVLWWIILLAPIATVGLLGITGPQWFADSRGLLHLFLGLFGADNPDGAEALIDWMLTDEVQSALPEAMYVFPVMPDATVPKDWTRFAPQPSDPYEVSPEEIATNREQWLTEWTDIISR